jgi:transcriptional regulator with XRE-family HTH domain
MDAVPAESGIAKTQAEVQAGLGERLRRLRKARQMSLRQLGEIIGTTASFISQLERGLTGASTGTLMRIADAFGVSIAELFDDRSAPAHRVLKRSLRPALPIVEGCRKTLLSERPLKSLEVYAGEFEIGGSTGPQLYTHGNAHEMLVVLRGTVEVSLGADRYVLEEGDSIEYATTTPHRTANLGNSRAEVLWIISPPTSPPEDLEQYRIWNTPVTG